MRRGMSRLLGGGAYFASTLILATLLLALVTLVAVRLDRLFVFPGARHGLSPRTTDLLATLSGDITCRVILPRNNLVYSPLNQMLEGFKELAAPNASLTLEFFDPQSDPARTAAIVRQYGARGWSVIFDNGRRFEIVPYDDLVETSTAPDDGLARAHRAVTRFRGEQVCATALAKLARPESPVVYALTGHDERDFTSYDSVTGYSDFARELAREGYVLRHLKTADAGIPDDCDLLLVAGPRFAPSPVEASVIAEYLGKGGRLLLLLDRAAATPGPWEPLLSRIGLRSTNLTAIGADTLGGYNLLSDNFGDHPVARYLDRSAVYFVDPQIIDPAPPADAALASQATIVVAAPEKAWGESNPDVLPRHYDKDVDRQGVLPLVLAVEGPGSAALGLKPFRAFVIGDSNFAANTLLEGGSTANRDLLLNAVSWLTERGGPTTPSAANEGAALRLAISRNRQIRFWIRSIVVWPFLTILLGAVMARIQRLTS